MKTGWRVQFFHGLIKLLQWESGWKATLVFYWLRSHLNSTYWLSSPLWKVTEEWHYQLCVQSPLNFVFPMFIDFSVFQSGLNEKKNCFNIAIMNPLFISWLGNILPFPFLDCISSFPRSLRPEERQMPGLGVLGFSLLQAFFQWPPCLLRSMAVARKSQPCPFVAEVAFIRKTTSQEKNKL